jgi:hypothetical protein
MQLKHQKPPKAGVYIGWFCLTILSTRYLGRQFSTSSLCICSILRHPVEALSSNVHVENDEDDLKNLETEEGLEALEVYVML